MPIKVKHSTGAGATAAAAFGGAQGRSRASAARGGAAAASRGYEAKLSRESQAKRSDLAHQRGLEARKTDREFRAEQAALGHERGIERQRLNAGIQQEAAVAAQGRRREDLTFSMTERQRIDLEQLADAEAKALASDDYTEEEKAEIRRKYASKRGGIQPVLRPKPLTPRQRYEQRHYEDKRGRVFSLDDEGNATLLHSPPDRQPSVQDRIKAFQAATAYATNPETGVVDQGRLREARASMGFGPDSDGVADEFTPEEFGDDEFGEEFGGGGGGLLDDVMSTPGGVGSGDSPSADRGGSDLTAPRDPRPPLDPKSPTAKLDKELHDIYGDADKPNTGNLAYDDVKDLATAKFQIEGARKRADELDAEYKRHVAKAGKSVGLGGPETRRLDLLQKPGVAHFEGERLKAKAKAARDRQTQMEGKAILLREKADMIEGRRLIQRSRAR